jgi:valyl-tRNA synthetase
MSDVPKGFDASQRDQAAGFTGEADIFDTWFTSSMTPQIGSHWGTDPARHAKLFPADIRPQGHDIIRTWAFYTIAKALLHEGRIPWRHVVVSGWVLDPDRKKMSKHIGNVVTPMPLIEQYTADGARYWAASARLGTDTTADEKVFRIGKRLATKIFNAGKFVLSQGGEAHPIAAELDQAFAARLRELAARATAAFDAFDHARALQETESFFWTHFTDTYLELVKLRARSEQDAEGRGSALSALRLGLDVLLRLFAPFLPYVTEEVWSWAFAAEKGVASIHRASWPEDSDFAGIPAPARAGSFEAAAACFGAIHKAKAEAAVSAGREVESLVLAAHPASLEALAPVLSDVLSGARCRSHQLAADPALEEGVFAVREPVFAERES